MGFQWDALGGLIVGCITKNGENQRPKIEHPENGCQRVLRGETDFFQL